MKELLLFNAFHSVIFLVVNRVFGTLGVSFTHTCLPAAAAAAYATLVVNRGSSW